MKKLFLFLAVILCVVMLSSTAFAGGGGAYGVYQSYRNAMKNVKSMELSAVYKDSVDTKDGSSTKVAMKLLITPDKQLQISWEYTYPDSETTYNYLKDGWIYMPMPYDSSGYKTKADKGETADMHKALATEDGICLFGLAPTKKELDGAKLENVPGGSKITFKYKNTNDLGDIIEITEATASITIGDDGMLKAYSEIGTLTRYLGDSSVVLGVVTYTSSVKVKSVNAFDTISFPPDLDDYEEM